MSLYYPQLTKSQKRHAALAEIPDSFRAKALKPFNLNDVARSCHGSSRKNENLALQIRRWPLHGFPGDETAIYERPHAKRNWAHSELNEKYPGGLWRAKGVKDIWKLRDALRKAIRKVEGIEDSNFNPFRVFNFASCGAKQSWGRRLSTRMEKSV